MRVRAVNVLGVSGASNQVTVTVTSTATCTVPPPVPTGFTGQTGGLLVALAWRASPGATSYRLDVGTSSGTTDGSAALGDVTTYQGIAPPGTYHTRVRAVNACGASAPSAELPVTLGCSASASCRRT